jgi:hypothetical protein
VNAVTLKGSYRLNSFLFAAGLAALASAGCGDDGSSTSPVGMAGTGAPAAGTGSGTAGTPPVTTAGTGAAGTASGLAGTGVAGTGAAGTGSGAAGMAAGAAGMGSAVAPTLTNFYSMVYANKCAICHAMAPADNANGKLGGIKTKDQFYEAVVNKPTQGVMCTGKGMYIVPNQPGMSVMVQKTSMTPPCGVQMPVGQMLEPEEAKLLSDWVAAGALNN